MRGSTIDSAVTSTFENHSGQLYFFCSSNNAVTLPLITYASNTAVTGKILNTAVTNFFKGNTAVTFEKLGLQIRCILNEDGSISVNVEDTAIGFGWIDKSKFGFSQQLAKDDYIRKTKFC